MPRHDAAIGSRGVDFVGDLALHIQHYNYSTKQASDIFVTQGKCYSRTKTKNQHQQKVRMIKYSTHAIDSGQTDRLFQARSSQWKLMVLT